MKVSLEYTSIGCNRISGCSDWGNNGIFVYAAHRSVALYDPKTCKIIKTLQGHVKRVNSVKWIPNGGKETELVSCGADNKIIIWRDDVILETISDHKQSVTSVSLLFVPKTKQVYLASTSSDSTVNVYVRQSDKFVKISTLTPSKKMMECCSLGVFHDQIFLAAGGLDDVIHLYTLENNSFVFKCRLAGHQDWIRCLDFKTHHDSLILASGSQDTKIRLWKISQESKQPIYEDKSWVVSFDALLTGHEEWVHSVKWHPTEDKIISSSMDRSMIIWIPEKTHGIWMNQVRMGEFGGLSGLFGQLGFYGCHFSPDGKQVLAHGYNGSFHLWEDNQGWKPQISISGHFSDVMDISWDPKHNYFMSVSLDQTCRIFSFYEKTSTWHEVSRPQVHGYDINCFSFVNNNEHKIVSGADEKVFRVFEGTQTFCKSIEGISKISSDLKVERPVGASVPMLGLSNRGVTEEVKETDETTGFKPITLEQPPFEEHLLQNTLWPESQKLYGHANEIYALASSNNGKFIASACKAKQAKEAVIMIWDTTTWNQVDTIKGHNLTVTQIAFSPNDQYLVSVSRDRTIMLCEFKDGKYQVVKQLEASDRIIWGVSWSHDGNYILIGSRDETVKIYDLKLNQISSYNCKDPVTSVEFMPDQDVFAVGFESGLISIYGMKGEILKFDANICACETIRRLKWRKAKDGYDLVCCSTDHSVRLYHIN